MLMPWQRPPKRPDKELCKRHKIRILSKTAKKAVASSNVDTEEEVLKVRKKKVPSKYWSESEGEYEIPTEKRRKMATSSQKPVSLPKPPSYKLPADITVTAHAPEEDEPSLPNLSANNTFHGIC
ncbi:hypothetical protein F2P79_025938, partial [Pimephales promelas]